MQAIQSAASTTDRQISTARSPATKPQLSKTAAELSRERGHLKSWMSRPPWLVLTQLFFAIGWLRAAAEKVISPAWWSGDTIRTFLAEHEAVTVAWFRPVLDVAVVDYVPLYVIGIVMAQLVCGLLLLINRRVSVALAVAMTMNIAFVAIGAVDPSAFYLVGQGAVALWLVGTHRPTAMLSTALRWTTGFAAAVTLISLPLIQTVDPHEVIDDPAAMLATLGGLTALGSELTHRAMFGRRRP